MARAVPGRGTAGRQRQACSPGFCRDLPWPSLLSQPLPWPCLARARLDVEEHFQILPGQGLPRLLAGNDGGGHVALGVLQRHNPFFNGSFQKQSEYRYPLRLADPAHPRYGIMQEACGALAAYADAFVVSQSGGRQMILRETAKKKLISAAVFGLAVFITLSLMMQDKVVDRSSLRL